MSRIIYTKYSNERTPEFAVKTDIIKYDDKHKVVRKSPADNKALPHVKKMIRWRDELKETFKNTVITPCECSWNDESQGVDFEFVKGVSLEKKLDMYLQNEEYDKLKAALEEYFEICRSAADKEFTSSDDFEKVFGKPEFCNKYKSFNVSDIDMIFANILISDDNWSLIDYEWCFDFPVPVDFVLYRALHYYVYTYKFREVLVDKGIFSLLGESKKDIPLFIEMEKKFQKYIEGNMVAVRTLYNTMGQAAHSIIGMLVEGAPGYSPTQIEVYKNFGSGFELVQKERYSTECENDIYTLRIPVEEGLNMLRIDPAYCGCEVVTEKFSAIWDDGKEEELLDAASYNAYRIEDNKFIFYENDPWFWLDVPENKSGVVILSYKIKMIDNTSKNLVKHFFNILNEKDNCLNQKDEAIADLDRQIDNLKNVLGEEQAKTLMERGEKEICQREIEELKGDIDELKEQIALIHESLSWKVTKPLRSARDAFKSK